uniref:MFS transporter n=1 Tax=Cyberlindnera americana TaxID=36016 RepID=A0A5P8N8Q2_9ASCO|nr:MFS transporter [Cyberlindnera americana]
MSKEDLEEQGMERAISGDSIDMNALEVAAHAQQKVEHQLTKWQAMKTYPKATAWIMFNVWMMVLLGYENQAGGIVISVPRFRQDFGYYYEGSYVLETNWQSIIFGVPIAVMAISSFGVSFFTDRYGRRLILVLMLIITIPSIAMEYVATSIHVFVAGKSLNALCLGCFNTICLSYVSEISPMALRGWSASACTLSMCIGPFICYLINNTTADYETRMAYRAVFIPQFIFSASCLIFAPFLPESPYYYFNKGQDDKALESLKRLYNPTQAQQQFALMKVTHEELKKITESSTYLDCFKKKDRKRTFLVLFGLWMSPMCGLYFVASYATYYYQLSGMTTKGSYQLSCGGQAMSVCGVVGSWFIIDRFGRRPLMFFGMISLTIVNFVIAGAGSDTSNKVGLKVATAFMSMYNFFYNIGIGPLPFILACEISSVSLRAKTLSMGSMISYAFSCMWSLVLPYMFNPDSGNMGSKINFIFAGLCLMSIFVFYFIQPETAGRSFEEIDEMYDKNIPPRKWSSYKTEKQVMTEKSFLELKPEVSHEEFAGDSSDKV